MRRTASVDIHSDFDFLPFHRAYIQRLEDDLVLSENPQFVSPQQWDVNFPIGAPFQAIDPSSPQANCINAATILSYLIGIPMCQKPAT